MPEFYELQRGILAKVTEDPPGSHTYRVDFDVVRIAQFRGRNGGYSRVPGEARAIIQGGLDGELRVAHYTPPERETPGDSGTDWQALAVKAVQKHLS